MKKLILLAAMAAVASVSFAKGWVQPWTPDLPAWESVVYSCDKPVPYRWASADDFMWEIDHIPSNINWWGRVSTKEQLYRPYYIAIYKASDLARCFPAWDSIVWRDCLKPYEIIEAGIDCQGFRVWKFHAMTNVWNPLVLPVGHYWIQISESDMDSYKPDAIDFWWSAHQPVELCPAMQFDRVFNVVRLLDPCNDKRDDLAFEIY